MRPGARVALGMSGGVDSSVAARLLTDAGLEVVGITCVFVDDEASQKAVEDARCVAEQLGIAHEARDRTAAFSCHVIDAFVDEYAAGRTPSPCVVCNRACKIPALIDAADELGCDFVATGHYANVVRRRDRFAIAQAAYAPKDQSYMLAMLSQDQLKRLLLPLGSLNEGKAAVRALAREWDLPVASKSDSQDICFIHGSHLDFLANRGLAGKPGRIVSLDGKVLGRHEGLHRYTIGQRKGLNIGGAPEPYYVVEKRPGTNELVVAFASEAMIGSVRVSRMAWQAIAPEEVAQRCDEQGSFPCSVKLRYRQAAMPCQLVLGAHDFVDENYARREGFEGGERNRTETLLDAEADSVQVVLEDPQATTAPGQYAVFYDEGVVIGGGVIERTMRV